MRDGAADEQRTKELAKWKAWDEFIASKTNTGFMQSSWWTEFRAARGYERFGTVVKDGETIVGGAVVLKHSFTPETCYYYMDEGPVLLEDESSAEQEEVFRAIMKFIDAKRQNEKEVVSHLRINPRWEHVPSFLTGFQEVGHYCGMPRDTLCIDLSIHESTILSQMKPKGRYNIGVARRYGVSVIEDVSPQGIADFLDIYAETLARKDLGGFDPDYFRTLITMASSLGRGSLFFAEYEGARLATAFLVYFGRTATYLFGGSMDTHRNVMAPYLLQFEMMRKAKSLGCQFYDMFGVTPQSASTSGWTDISTFKRKFGGQEINLVPTLDYIYDPIAYHKWKAIEEE